MKRNLIEDLFDPSKSFLLFLVVGSFGLPIVSTIISELVLNNAGAWVESKWGISQPIFRLILFAAILLPLLVVFYLSKLSQWIGNWYTPTTVKPQPLKATFPGLIVLASTYGVNSPAHVAIKHHWQNGNGNLNYCWIICGGTKSSDAAREFLAHEFGIRNQGKFNYEIVSPDNNNRKLTVIIKNLSPPNNDDPQKVFLLVNKIFLEANEFGIDESQIIADYTGGTKSMTSGIILACANPQRRLQFMKPGGYLENGYADQTKDAIATEVQVAFKLKPIKVKN